MIYAIIIWMATAATGGYACSEPMPLAEAQAWVANHPRTYLVASSDPQYQAQIESCKLVRPHASNETQGKEP